MNIVEINHFEGTHTSMSSASANDNGFRLVSIQWQAVQCEPPSKQSDGREESSLIFQWNIQLSVVSILWKTDTETGNDVDDRWHIQREQLRTQYGFLRNAELANHCLGSTATDRDELRSEPLQCSLYVESIFCIYQGRSKSTCYGCNTPSAVITTGTSQQFQKYVNLSTRFGFTSTAHISLFSIFLFFLIIFDFSWNMCKPTNFTLSH